MTAVTFNDKPETKVVPVDCDGESPYLPLTPRPTRIPFNRMTSREERCERKRLRGIFDRYDGNNDGFLDRMELQVMIKEHPDELPDLPHTLVKMPQDPEIVSQIDFDQFFKLTRMDSVVREICVNFCRQVVPPRNDTITEETVSGYSMSTYYDSVDGAYEAEMTFCPPPFTMIVISIIEVLFFVVDIHYKGFMINRGGGGDTIMGPAATIFIYDPSKRIQIWRFVTYMFVHADIMHLVTNLVFQLVLGIILELVHCWWRVGLIYLSGVLAGSIGSSIVNKGIFLCGASGGVYALLTAHVATIIINWREMKYAMIQLFLLLIYFSNDFWSSFYRQWEDPLNNVSYVSHLSGAAAGILVGIGVLRNLSVQSYEKKLWWFAVTFYITLISAGIAYNVAFSKLFYYSHESMEKSSI